MYKLRKYGAKWCNPCNELDELLEKLNIQYEDIDIESNPTDEKIKRLTAIPYLEFLDDDGNVINSHIGAIGKTHLLKLLNDA